jgi:hypothetical protein
MKNTSAFVSFLFFFSTILGCITSKSPDPDDTLIMYPKETRAFQVTLSTVSGYICETSWSIVDTSINSDQPTQHHEEIHMQHFTNGKNDGITYTPDESSPGWYRVLFARKYYPLSHVAGVDTDEITGRRETVQWDVVVWNSAIGGITVSDIPYGSRSNQVGVYNAGEGAYGGPDTFALDEDGNVYVCDTINQRIQVFSPTGEYLRSVYPSTAIIGRDISSGLAVNNGLIYVYTNENTRETIFQLAQNGVVFNSFPIDTSRWSQYNTSYKSMHIVGDSVYLCVESRAGEATIHGDVLVARVVDGMMVPPTPEELQAPLQEGILAADGNRYPEFDPALGFFMGLDRSMNRYYSAYAFTNGVNLRQVNICDRNGILIRTLTTPGGDYPYGTHKTVDITGSGTIVQMMPGSPRLYLSFMTLL